MIPSAISRPRPKPTSSPARHGQFKPVLTAEQYAERVRMLAEAEVPRGWPEGRVPHTPGGPGKVSGIKSESSLDILNDLFNVVQEHQAKGR